MPDSLPTTPAVPQKTWRDTVAVYLEAPTLRMLLLGFSAGLPLVLVLGTLSFWLREAGLDRATIGYLSLVGLAYAFKWVWSPLVDRLPLPALSAALGQRRAWLLLAQALVAGGLVGMAMHDPRESLQTVVFFTLLVAFASATQDIALDAFRIESADADRQAALAAAYQSGYRIAMIWAGAGVLWIAARAEVANATTYQHAAWQTAYLGMAASMLVGMLTVLWSPEPAAVARPPSPAGDPARWVQDALVEPFADFFRRYRERAVFILLLVALYRISDVVMGIMANPFYVDMGYTKSEVAMVSKVYGLIMTLLGAFVGGALSVRLGLMRVLMLGAVLSAASNLLYVWLTTRGHDVDALVWVISADNLSSGIAAAAFIAYMSSLTKAGYSATQYALFSSLMVTAPKLIAGYSGVMVDAMGYSTFFTLTALMGVPVLGLVWVLRKG